MNASKTLLNIVASVLASVWMPFIAAFIVALVCLLAMDIPQGSTDALILRSYPVNEAPFIVTLGLHRLGRSVVLWLPFVFVLAHMAIWANKDKQFIGALVAFLSICVAIFATSFTSDSPTSQRALRVRTSHSLESVLDVIENTDVFLPDKQGTFRFGSDRGGPYAVAKDLDGRLRAFLPSNDPSPFISIAARRPSKTNDSRLSDSVTFIVFLISLVIFLGIAGITPEYRFMGVVAISSILFIAGPAMGIGSLSFPLADVVTGEQTFFEIYAISPSDLGPWLSVIPATAVVRWPVFLNIAGACFVGAGLFSSFFLRSTKVPRYTYYLAAVLLLLNGTIVFVHTVFRLPIASEPEVLGLFETNVLGRIPLETALLSSNLSSQGPFSISLLSGLSFSLKMATAGTGIILSIRKKPLKSFFSITMPLLFATALLRAFFSTASTRPYAALTVTLVVAALAAVSIAIRRLHPARSDPSYLVALVATSLMVACYYP